MTNNYIGPGWYWVVGMDSPCYVERHGDGTLRCRLGEMAFGVHPESITRIPRPAQRPVVDWSVMPAWAKYIAQDEGGEWCWFVEKPDHDNSVWLPEFGRTGTIPMSYSPKYTGDWRNSLVERPE